MERFYIDIKCDFEELWRYNIIAMAGVFVGGEQVDVLKHASEVAPVGAMLSAAPEGYIANRNFSLTSDPAEALTLYIYIIPHTFTKGLVISDVEPFELDVVVRHGTRTVHKHRYEINQWSGENIEIKIGM